ncbi:MAG: type II secretion system F family protein [Streptosporangiales bacterium]
MVIASGLAVLLAGLAGWLAVGELGSQRRLEALCARRRGSGATRTLSLRARGVLLAAWHRARRSRLERASRDAIVELCGTLAAELRAGRPPLVALQLATEALDQTGRELFRGVVTAAERGADVPGAMRTIAARPGCRGMAWLAACWQVGVESGAGLAEAIERLAAALRAEERNRHEVRAQLAAPRATARLLAVLPVIGIVMATGLGQHPVRFLVGSPYGIACLAAGVGIDVLGVMWTSRLARAAEPG